MQIPDQFIGVLCGILRIRRGYANGTQIDGFNKEFNRMGMLVSR